MLEKDPKKSRLIFESENTQREKYLNCLGKYLMVKEVQSNVTKEIIYLDAYANTQDKFALTADEIKDKVSKGTTLESGKRGRFYKLIKR